jgi:predicted  nucleic acid-binding Zn-ribbon protein
MFGTSPEDKFKLSLLSIEKKFLEIDGEIKDLQQRMQNVQIRNFGTNKPAPADFNQKFSNINARISRLEQELRSVKSKIHITAASDDQIKDLLEKIILLETRVSVLEKNITEPQKIQPIILE